MERSGELDEAPNAKWHILGGNCQSSIGLAVAPTGVRENDHEDDRVEDSQDCQCNYSLNWTGIGR